MSKLSKHIEEMWPMFMGRLSGHIGELSAVFLWRLNGVGKLSGHFGRSFLCSKGVIVDLLGRSGLCSGEAGWTYWEGLDNEWGG